MVTSSQEKVGKVQEVTKSSQEKLGKDTGSGNSHEIAKKAQEVAIIGQ